MVDEAKLAVLEQHYPLGLTSAQLLEAFAAWDVQLSEATLRKYVQLGLLPRSVRVGRKGKHSGSQGIYPVGVARRILRIKELLAGDLTIEQIQRDYSLLWNELQQLERGLGELFERLREATLEHTWGKCEDPLATELEETHRVATGLMQRLHALQASLEARKGQQRLAAS